VTSTSSSTSEPAEPVSSDRTEGITDGQDRALRGHGRPLTKSPSRDLSRMLTMLGVIYTRIGPFSPRWRRSPRAASTRPPSCRSAPIPTSSSDYLPPRSRRHSTAERLIETMDYTRFIKKLELPAGFAAPMQLAHDDLVAIAINRMHLHDDVAGINASIELIQRTRGGRWPTGPSPKSRTSSTSSGTRPSSEKEPPSPTPSTTPRGTTSAAATSTRSGGAPS
jgi:hypothetical protein